MYDIVFSEKNNIYVDVIDKLTANIPFIHEDRIAATYVLIYVISGCIYVTEEENEYEIRPGELLILKQGTHQFGHRETLAGTSWYFSHFCINGELDETMVQIPKYIKTNTSFDVEGRLRELVELKHSGNTFSNNLVSMGLQKLLIDLYEEGLPPKKKGISERVRDYLEINYNRNISSKEIEEYFHLSYKYLAKSFYASEHRSIMQYHSNYRILETAKLLKTTDDTISQISAKVGFEDPLYFSKCFKKQMGLSPKEYRKQVIQTF